MERHGGSVEECSHSICTQETLTCTRLPKWSLSARCYLNCWRTQKAFCLSHDSRSLSFLSASTWKDIIASAVGGLAISLAYGLDIKETNDPHVERAETAFKSILGITGSGIYLVDILPILRHVPSWVPGATFQKQVKVLRKIQENFRHLPYDETIRNIVRLFYQKLPDDGSDGDRPLEVLSRRLWWMPSAISTRLEIWRISKLSSKTPRPLSSLVGHLFSHPLAIRVNPLCSCCRHNTVNCTYHVCRDALFPRGTVQGTGGAWSGPSRKITRVRRS